MSSTKPLSGLVVVEIGHSIAAPYAGMILGELGAEVIKVENPKGGDACRGWGPPFLEGAATCFHAVNRAKAGITIDLADGQDAARLRARELTGSIPEMDERLMQTMLDVDEHHWWYRGRRRIIQAELDRLALPNPARVLDAGCGSGRTLQELVRYGAVEGIELNPDAAEVAARRGYGEVKVGRLEELPWSGDTFDLITCLDVIEHTPDDRAALRELRRVSKPAGWLLVTVPGALDAWEAILKTHGRFDLARALWETNTTRDRALRLAAEARAAYARSVSSPVRVADIDRWLSSRTGS